MSVISVEIVVGKFSFNENSNFKPWMNGDDDDERTSCVTSCIKRVKYCLS